MNFPPWSSRLIFSPFSRQHQWYSLEELRMMSSSYLESSLADALAESPGVPDPFS